MYRARARPDRLSRRAEASLTSSGLNRVSHVTLEVDRVTTPPAETSLQRTDWDWSSCFTNG